MFGEPGRKQAGNYCTNNVLEKNPNIIGNILRTGPLFFTYHH